MNRDGSRSPRPFTSAVRRLLAAQLLTGILVTPVATFFPVYLQDLGYSALIISWIATLQRATCLFSTLAAGALSDALGSKRTLIAGQAAYFAGALLFLATGAGPVALIWAIYGAGQGLYSVGSLAYLMEKAELASLGLLTAFFHWGYTLGGAAGNPAVGVLLFTTGYRGLTPFIAIPALLVVIASAFLLPRSGRAASPGTRSPRRILGGLAGYAEVAARPALLILAWLRFLPTFCYGLLLVFVPLRLKAAGASNQVIALYATASSICASLGQLLVGRLADRVSWKAPTMGALSILALSSLGIALLPGSLWSVFVCASLAIAAAWSLSTLLPTLVAKAAVPAEQGRVLGFVQLFWNLAMILSGLTGGVLYQAWQGLPFLAGAAAGAGALFLGAAFFAATRGAPGAGA